MSSPIRFEGVWKKFYRGEHHDSLRDLLPSITKRMFGGAPSTDIREHEFWAVRDVSFDVARGEALGIVGPNGAGKSTILKLLTRILRPTRGRCVVDGRVGALIEVSAGFHPDLTGRENVFLQGAINGMKRAEIARKFDEIVEFSGISEFIDTPVKRYSSGMNARLGFAIASSFDPDVLIIDEVLSVGDSKFQERCITRLREFRSRGVPLVFVSHNLPSVAELCTKALLMQRGRVVYSGDVGRVLQRYRQVAAEEAASGERPKADIWISSVRVLDETGHPTERLSSSDTMTVRIGYETARPVDSPSFAVDVMRADGVYCFGVGMSNGGHNIGTVSGRGCVDLHISPLQLTAGFYNISVGIHRSGGISVTGRIDVYDLREFAYPFAITCDRADLGVVCLNHAWHHVPGVESRDGAEPLAEDRSTSAQDLSVSALKEVAVS